MIESIYMKVVNKTIVISELPFFNARNINKTNNCNTNALIIFPEAYGLTGNCKTIASDYARMGFDVFVFPLYEEENYFIEYSNKEERDRKILTLNTETITKNIIKTSNFFSEYKSVSTIGYSIGGYAALLCSSLLNISNAFIYYPNPTINNKRTNLDPMNSFLSKINSNVTIFHGSRDTSCQSTEINLIINEIKNCSSYEFDAKHGFTCNTRKNAYSKSSTKQSILIIKKTLGIV